MERIKQFSVLLNRVLMGLAGVCLLAMIGLTCANIFLRLFGMPVRGTFELMGFLGAAVTAFALGYTQIRRGHIAVDVLINTFSRKTRQVLSALNNAICMAFFLLIAWQLSEKAQTLYQTGEVSETLRVVYYPFTYGVALGCLVLALVFATDFLKSFFNHVQGDK